MAERADQSTLVVHGQDPAIALPVSRRRVIAVIGDVDFRLEAAAGQVWLTHERAPQDDVLAAGQRIDLPAGRRVFLSGLPSATVKLTPHPHAAD